MDDKLKELLVDVVAEECMNESKRLVADFKSRDVAPQIAEIAVTTVAVGLTAKSTFQYKGDKTIAELKQSWLDALSQSFDNAIELLQKDADGTLTPEDLTSVGATRASDPSPNEGELRDKLMSLLQSNAADAEREYIQKILAGEPCDGCGDVHEVGPLDRAQMEARLKELKKSVN